MTTQQHNPLRLPEDQQDIIAAELEKKGGTLLAQSILNGIIDPANIRNMRRSLKAFQTTDNDTQRTKDKAAILAKRDEPVMLLGESGTGKDLLAHIIHGDRKGEFVAVNVCAVTDTLFESELFGHVRGSFTGADKDRVGLIEQAANGTLFLDEIGDMPLDLQAKLLRVIHNRVYRRVGSNVNMEMACRVVVATHRDLPTMIREGKFRLDLYERLSVFQLRLKPLRERWCDAELYVGKEFVEKLRNLPCRFSGNVRQLLNLKLRCDVFGDEELNGEATL